VIVCGTCGLKYSAAAGRGGTVWLRCNGQITHRGKIHGRCPSKSIKLSDLAPLVQADIERFLRNPGDDLIDDLAEAESLSSAAAALEAERIGLESAIASAPKQRKQIMDLMRRGTISDGECAEQLDDIARTEEQQRRRLAELLPAESPDEPDADLLQEITQRIDAGFDDLLWQEIVQHLVRRIVVQSKGKGRAKRARIVIEYRFPGVDATDRGTGSSQPRA
jgi:hypothetical protein